MAALSPSVSAVSPRQTRILPVHRLNSISPPQSIAEWWASEQQSGSAEAAAVAEAAELLRTGNTPVGFPTETVYGLGADATRSAAVQGIYRAKQRPRDNPLIVHVDSEDMIERLLNPPAKDTEANGPKNTKRTIPDIYRPLIERFWPGPLTILLPNPPNSILAPEVTAKLHMFGVRIPSSPFARLLIHATGRPLAAPSANASTKPSPTIAQHVYHDLQGRIDLILDGGPCGVGVESTVVDGLSSPPAILRPGGVGIDEIRACPGWEKVRKAYKDEALQLKEIPPAPGMKYRHYSPKADVVLFETGSNPTSISRRVNADLKNTAVGARKVGFIRTRTWEYALGLAPPSSPPPSGEIGSMTSFTLEVEYHPTTYSTIKTTKTIYDIHLGQKTEDIARGLFAALRAMDLEDVDIIYVEGIPDNEGELAAAVMNRLRKAAEVEIRKGQT